MTANNKSALQFTDIEIIRMPGFTAAGFEVDQLCGGINVIYGPNASGKTTLARAIHALIWPTSLKRQLKKAQLKSRWKLDNKHWQIDLNRGKIYYHCDDAIVSAPIFPPDEQRDRYHLYLNELLDASNAPLAEAIARESAGGYDIKSAFEALGVRPDRPRRGEKTRTVDLTFEKLQQALQGQQALINKQQTLNSLKQQRVDCQRARYHAHLISSVQEYKKAQEQFIQCKAGLRVFPEVIARLNGDEPEKFTALEKSREIAAKRLQETQAKFELISQQLAKLAQFQGNADHSGNFQVLQQYLEALRECEQQLHQLAQQAQAAHEKHNAEQRRLTQTEHALKRPLTEDEINECLNVVSEAEDIRADILAIQRQQQLLETSSASSGSHGTTTNTLQTGIHYLQRWLSTSAADSTNNRSTTPTTLRWTKALLIICALSVALCALALGYFVSAMWLLLLLVSAVLMGCLILALKPTSTEDTSHQVYQLEYEKLGLPKPVQWTAADIEALLTELMQTWANAKLEDEKEKRLQELSDDHSRIERRQQQLEVKCTAIMEKCGLSLDLDTAKSIWLIKRLSALHEAENQALELDARQTALYHQTQLTIEKINGLFAQYDLSPATDLYEARAKLDELQKRYAKAQKTQHDYELLHQQLQTCEQRYNESCEAIDDFMKAFDLSVHDFAILENLAQQKTDYLIAERAYNRATQFHDHALQQLQAAYEEFTTDGRYADEFGSMEQLIEKHAIELDELALQLHTLIESIDEITRQIMSLEAEIEQAMHSNAVEEARANYEHARAELELEREDHQSFTIRRLLCDYVREQTQDAERPEVFHRARQIFQSITGQTYRLDIDEQDGPQFRAWDNIQQKSLHLDELSSGTRLQLLLAVRIAFVEALEQGIKLPLVLDETLANSDDDRANAIIAAIQDIAAQGRQIFYFTARADEVQKWKELAPRVSSVDYRFIELSALVSPDSPDSPKSKQRDSKALISTTSLP